MYRIAHFSDFHLKATNKEFYRALALVDLAIRKDRVAHLVITGDIVNRANMEVYAAFIENLRDWGWGKADRLTVVPGNHDVYTALAKGNPNSRFEKLCRVTGATRSGRGTSLLVRNTDPPPRKHSFPFGKRLAPGVVITGLDTVSSNAGWTNLNSVQGEIDEVDRRAVTGYLQEHRNAKHRIIAMHHCPIDTDFVAGFIEQNFVDPKPDEVQDWIKETGANLVLCGHVHAIYEETLSSGATLLNSGASGGHYRDDSDTRSYYLVDLFRSGRIEYKTRDLNIWELDKYAAAHFDS